MKSEIRTSKSRENGYEPWCLVPCGAKADGAVPGNGQDVLVTDTGAAGAEARFYRVRRLPQAEAGAWKGWTEAGEVRSRLGRGGARNADATAKALLQGRGTAVNPYCTRAL